MANTMTTIRTVSDLTELTTRPDANDLIEVSHTLGSNKYCSQKYRFSSLRSDVSSVAVDAVKKVFNATTTSGDVAIDIRRDTDFTAQVSAAVKIDDDNMVGFVTQPVLLDENGDYGDDSVLQTKSQVRNTVEAYSAYVGADSYLTCDPSNDEQCTQDYSYFWKIESGTYDSSLAYDENGFQIGGVTINETGYLVVYGWLAANATVQPQNAWVGLYGMFDGKWTLLQMQPWIVGKNSQLMQYVGFNIPVRAGLQLKIKTGFPVNGSVSGLQTYSHTLLLAQDGNVVNSFVGYVVMN